LEQRIQTLERRHHQEHVAFQHQTEQALLAANNELQRLQMQQCMMRDQVADLEDRLAALSSSTKASAATFASSPRATCLLSSGPDRVSSSTGSPTYPPPSSPQPLSVQQISAELDQAITPEWKERLARRRGPDPSL
jgi:uncharacterized coiled-coil protein SlyX